MKTSRFRISPISFGEVKLVLRGQTLYMPIEVARVLAADVANCANAADDDYLDTIEPDDEPPIDIERCWGCAAPLSPPAGVVTPGDDECEGCRKLRAHTAALSN